MRALYGTHSSSSGSSPQSPALIKQTATNEFDHILPLAESREKEEAEQSPACGQQQQDDEDGEPEV